MEATLGRSAGDRRAVREVRRGRSPLVRGCIRDLRFGLAERGGFLRTVKHRDEGWSYSTLPSSVKSPASWHEPDDLIVPPAIAGVPIPLLHWRGASSLVLENVLPERAVAVGLRAPSKWKRRSVRAAFCLALGSTSIGELLRPGR